MYVRFIRNDIGQSKVITLITTVFVAAAAMLVSLAAILAVHLTGAIDTLMTKAKTPHFMQMHAGDIDVQRLAAFAEQHHNVEDYQIIEFLNMDGTQIVIGDRSLSDSVQDNGFAVQSKQFDFLLNLDGEVITVSNGELYVPISYMQNNAVKIGEKAIISGKEFTIAGALRDSQMNSTLSASKRFLVSEEDFAAIRSLGTIEYLIEFRLKDGSALGEFESAYVAAGLEANGPTVTYPLFKLINSISDGMMIAVILLVSALVVAVSLMCIRFTLLARIEDDYREIGVMRALGMRVSDVKKIYLMKYAAIAAAGSLIGFALSSLFKGRLLENIRLYMGESETSIYAFLFGLVGILLIFIVIIAFVHGTLRRFRKISAAEAIRFGTTQEKGASANRFHLRTNRVLHTNIFLGLKDVFSRKRLYATMLIVLVISSFIVIVPHNLYNTISSRSFIQYMGVGMYDIRMDIQQTDHIATKTEEILSALKHDTVIEKAAVFTTKTFKTITEEGTEENIKVELGDHTIFPIIYSKGSAPIEENEIALSAIHAEEMGKKVGDALTLVISEEVKHLTVSGIYSDITNGGKTAKAAFADQSTDTMWSIVSVALFDPSLIDTTVSAYAERFEFAKVSRVEQFVSQLFGSTIHSIKQVSHTALGVALLITFMITILFMKMLVAKDRYSIALLKVLGFTNKDIKAQFISRSFIVLMLGLLLGTLLANTLGEKLAGAVIASFGASTFHFSINGLWAFLLNPLMMVLSVLIATMIGISGVRHIQISEHIKE